MSIGISQSTLSCFVEKILNFKVDRWCLPQYVDRPMSYRVERNYANIDSSTTPFSYKPICKGVRLRPRQKMTCLLLFSPPNVTDVTVIVTWCDHAHNFARCQQRILMFGGIFLWTTKKAQNVLQKPALVLGARCLTWEPHRGQFHWKSLGDSAGERQRVGNSSQRRAAHQAGAEGMDSDFAGCALHWYPACREAFAIVSQIMGDT